MSRNNSLHPIPKSCNFFYKYLTIDTTTAMTKEIQGSKLSGVGSPRTQTASNKDWRSVPERKRTRTHTIASELIVKNQNRILKWICYHQKALCRRIKIEFTSLKNVTLQAGPWSLPAGASPLEESPKVWGKATPSKQSKLDIWSWTSKEEEKWNRPEIYS